MNALEKILEKCEFSEQKVWRDCGYDDESEPGVKQIIGGGKAVHSDLMPIIRELCAIAEEQQKALEQLDSYLNWRADDLVGDDLIGDGKLTAGFNAKINLINQTHDSTTQRLTRLASDGKND